MDVTRREHENLFHLSEEILQRLGRLENDFRALAKRFEKFEGSAPRVT